MEGESVGLGSPPILTPGRKGKVRRGSCHILSSAPPPPSRRPTAPLTWWPSPLRRAHLGPHLRAGASAGRRKRRHRRLPALPPHPPGPPAATMSASAVFILDVKGKVRLGAGSGRPTGEGCSLSNPGGGPSLQAARPRKALGAWEHPSPNSWDSRLEPHLHFY